MSLTVNNVNTVSTAVTMVNWQRSSISTGTLRELTLWQPLTAWVMMRDELVAINSNSSSSSTNYVIGLLLIFSTIGSTDAISSVVNSAEKKHFFRKRFLGVLAQNWLGLCKIQSRILHQTVVQGFRRRTVQQCHWNVNRQFRLAHENLGLYIEEWNYCTVYGKRIGQIPCSTEHRLSWWVNTRRR